MKRLIHCLLIAAIAFSTEMQSRADDQISTAFATWMGKCVVVRYSMSYVENQQRKLAEGTLVGSAPVRELLRAIQNIQWKADGKFSSDFGGYLSAKYAMLEFLDETNTSVGTVAMPVEGELILDYKLVYSEMTLLPTALDDLIKCLRALQDKNKK